MDPTARDLAARLFDVPIIQNQYRSAFVEAMIAPYLATVGWRYVGDGWNGWDFEHQSGDRLELKQSAAQQTWSTPDGARTRGAFDIAARSGYFDQVGSRWNAEPGRLAHLYVLAWYGSYGPEADHRDSRQWGFYVVPTSQLPENQRTISLSRLKKIVSAPTFLGALGAKVSEVCASFKIEAATSANLDSSG
jgi:hypothetical protein